MLRNYFFQEWSGWQDDRYPHLKTFWCVLSELALAVRCRDYLYWSLLIISSLCRHPVVPSANCIFFQSILLGCEEICLRFPRNLMQLCDFVLLESFIGSVAFSLTRVAADWSQYFVADHGRNWRFCRWLISLQMIDVVPDRNWCAGCSNMRWAIAQQYVFNIVNEYGSYKKASTIFQICFSCVVCSTVFQTNTSILQFELSVIGQLCIAWIWFHKRWFWMRYVFFWPWLCIFILVGIKNRPECNVKPNALPMWLFVCSGYGKGRSIRKEKYVFLKMERFEL